MSEDHYTYRVTWSPEDGEYVGLCLEFRSLSWLAGTRDEAFSGICQLVEEVLDDMEASNEPPPEPLASRSYSGKFVVRVPPETHRELVVEAAEEGVSLNRLVNARLLQRPAERVALTQRGVFSTKAKAGDVSRAKRRSPKGGTARR